MNGGSRCRIGAPGTIVRDNIFGRVLSPDIVVEGSQGKNRKKLLNAIVAC